MWSGLGYGLVICGGGQSGILVPVGKYIAVNTFSQLC